MPESILVLGLGVIGSVYALRFAKAGYAVAGIARGERLATLRSGGLRVRNVFLDEEESADIELLDHVPEGRAFDLVFVCVRAGQVMDAMRSVAKLGPSGAVVVIGNNLGSLDEEAAIVGPARFVPGFGAFGGYHDGGVIAYTDGRTKDKPEQRSGTTLGVLSPSTRPALDAVAAALDAAGLPHSESPDMRSYLVCHAALVFPLAGSIYAGGGDQARVCRTRDALVLGIRACRELFGALKALGYRLEPARLGSLLGMPEPLLVRYMRKAFAGEGARIAMFGHANAVQGRGEIGSQAAVLDAIARKAGKPLPNWDRLLPHVSGAPGIEPLPDGSRAIRLRLW